MSREDRSSEELSNSQGREHGNAPNRHIKGKQINVDWRQDLVSGTTRNHNVIAKGIESFNAPIP